MLVVELAKDAHFALTVSLAPDTSAEFALAIPELKSALFDWMRKRDRHCAEVIISVTMDEKHHTEVRQDLDHALRNDDDLAPLRRTASIQITLLDADGMVCKSYSLADERDAANTSIQAGTTTATGKKSKPPPTKARAKTGAPAKDRHGGRDSSARSMTLLVVLGLAVPAVLLVCVGIGVVGLLVLRSGPAKQDVVAQVVAEMPVANPVPDPPIVQPLNAPPGVAGKKTFDLIPLIDPQRDSVENRKWAIRNNVLHCDDAHFVPRMQIPYRPPQEYDFTVVFSQPGLRNGIALIMPNPNGGSFFWYLGAGNGSEFGFQANPNKGGQQPGLVQPNVACTTTVQVRNNSLKGLVNGNVMVAFNTDYRDLTCDNWRNLPDKSALGIACDDPTAFHFVQITEITGQGKRTR
jgi:hypothetical protein